MSNATMVKSFEVGDTFATGTSHGASKYVITQVTDLDYRVKALDGSYETTVGKSTAHSYLESGAYVPWGATELVGKHFRTSSGDGPVHIIERLGDPDYHEQNSVRIRMLGDSSGPGEGTIWGAQRVRDIIQRGDWVYVDSDSVDVVKDPTPRVEPGDKLRATKILPSELLTTLQRDGNDVGELIHMSGGSAYVRFPNDRQLYVDEWEIVKDDADDLIGKTFKLYDTIYKIGEAANGDGERYSFDVWRPVTEDWSNGTGGTYSKEGVRDNLAGGSWNLCDDPSVPVVATAPTTDESAMLASLREQLAAAEGRALTARSDERRRIVASLDQEAENREWCTEYDEWLRQEGLEDYSSRDVDVDVTVTATFSVSVPRSVLDSGDTRQELFDRWSPSQYDIDEWEVTD
jgi:hypothetical protein